MNRDLEAQLDEMGPAYRAVADRLCRARQVSLRPPRVWWARRSLLAASMLLFVCLGISCAFLRERQRDPAAAASAFGAREYRLSVAEMIRTQGADGGWANDFLTRRNAQMLSRCSGKDARVAYKRALRNLRVRGLL